MKYVSTSTSRLAYGGWVSTSRSTASARRREASPFAGSMSPATRKKGTQALLPLADCEVVVADGVVGGPAGEGQYGGRETRGDAAERGRPAASGQEGISTQASSALCAAGRVRVRSATPTPTAASQAFDPIRQARTTAPAHHASTKAKTGSLETSWNRPAYGTATSSTSPVASAAEREIGATAHAQPRSERA